MIKMSEEVLVILLLNLLAYIYGKQSIEMLISVSSSFWEYGKFSCQHLPLLSPHTRAPSSIYREIPGLWVLSAGFFGLQSLLMAFVVQRKREAAR